MLVYAKAEPFMRSSKLWNFSFLAVPTSYISWKLYGLICPVAHKEPIPPLCTLFYLQYDTLYFTMMYITALQWCTLQLYNDVRYSGSYLINSHLLHWNKSMNEGAQRMKDYVCFVLCGILQHIAQWLTDSRGSIGNLPN